jgi:hypothetical protein
MLAVGSVNLTTVRLLGPHLTAENHRTVLESARGKRKSEVEEIVARLSPRPEVSTTVRKLPEKKLEPKPAPSPTRAPEAVVQLAPVPAAGPAVLTPPAQLSPRQGCRGEVTPLSPDRYKLQLTIGGSTLEKLRLAKDMLRHAIPSGDDEAVLDRALTVLLGDLARKKFAAAEKPSRSRVTAPGSRHIPAEVKRAVWLRDLGRCAFVAVGGRRCSERGFVEFHHVRPYAAGGEASVSNIELRCRRHNDHEARVYFSQGRGSGVGNLVRERATPYRPGTLQARGLELVPERPRTSEPTARPVRPVATTRRTLRTLPKPCRSQRPEPLGLGESSATQARPSP